MQDNYKSFDLETTFGKSTVTQERVSLVASHMYKQYLDYNNAGNNGYQCFSEIMQEVQIVVDLLKQSFAARNIPTQNIFLKTDEKKSVVMLNILWQKISFSIRSNIMPQSLQREIGKASFPSFRIMAINGNYDELMENTDEEEIEVMLRNEVASLYIPAEKNQTAIMTIKYLANKEFPLSSVDASREFILKVLEIVCGGDIPHQMTPKKIQFNI